MCSPRHQPAVAQAEAIAVDALHAPDIGRPVPGDRYVLIGPDIAGHARCPEELIAERAVDELVQIRQVLQELPAGVEGRRDKLDQAFRIVGRDVAIGKRRAERLRMPGLRDVPLLVDAQALLLDALAAADEHAALPGVHEGRDRLIVSTTQRGSWHGMTSPVKRLV